jgi:hypothetical protein
VTTEAGKTRKSVNGLDFALLVVILLSAVGFGMAKAGHAGVNKVIQGVSKIAIKVYLVGFKTEDLDLFKAGDKVSMTIRNQPVQPPMTVAEVKHWPKQVAFLAPDGKKAVSFPDPTQPLAHDFLVTITDQAEITAEGYVVRGNKIKVGNQIDLEGFKYRVQGVVVDLNPIQ